LRMSGDDCVIEAKSARRQGRLSDATALYEEAAESFRAEQQPARWAHALRHAAEFAIRAGDSVTGLREARVVVEYYRSTPPTTLEMANALRVMALAESSAGERDRAMEHWSEARRLYREAGIADGVLEAERQVALLSAAA
jgi:tetratricopeptide (TPR) repeat protein